MVVKTILFIAWALLVAGIATLAAPTISDTRNDVEIEHRTLDEIYEAALKESGTLTVAWGGDSKFSRLCFPHLLSISHAQSAPLETSSPRPFTRASREST